MSNDWADESDRIAAHLDVIASIPDDVVVSRQEIVGKRSLAPQPDRTTLIS